MTAANGGIIITNARSQRCETLNIRIDGSAGGASDAPVGPDTRTGTPKDAGPDLAPVPVRAHCEVGKDMTCNDDPAATVPWGICQTSGCSCKSGYVINANMGKCAQPAASACAGTYRACGCSCCMIIPEAVCYYANGGESLSAIKAADEARKSPGCMGCEAGLLYQCCVESIPEPAGNAQYTAIYTTSPFFQLDLLKTKESLDCGILTLYGPLVRITEPGKPYRVTMPAGWRIAGVHASDGPSACGDGHEGEGIGAQGSITFNRKGDSCTISAHLTLFYYDSQLLGVTTMRMDADDLPITNSVLSELCP
jgi:hypothetical protein